jgi:hypothetical protein
MTEVKCCNEGCDEEVTLKVYWPGQGCKLMCSLHGNKAIGIANVMGFNLHLELYNKEVKL